MRRLYSYILLAVTSLLLVGTTFSIAVKRTNSNIEYSQGRELVFRLSEKDEEGAAKLDDIAQTQEIADVMASRLEESDISRYRIETEGIETIKLTVGSDENYSNLIEYMSFDGSFALSTSNSEHVHDHVKAFGDNGFLVDENGERLGKAYLSTLGGVYPCVVLPINTESSQYQLVYDWAKEEGKAQKEANGSGEDAEEYYYLYLWYHFDEEKCTYDEYKSNENGFANRMLMKFPIFEDASRQYFNGENELYWTFDIGSGTTEEKEKAFSNARFLVNLLNADVLDYNVTAISSTEYAAPWYESLISYDSNISQVKLSKTFLATVCAIAIVSFLLIGFYRLAALAIGAVSITTTYLGYWAMIWLNATFNSLAVFALILIAITSLASGCVYVQKIKEECYRGRSLKKANIEGSKKALLPIVDISVIAIVIGIFCYIFGGAMVRSFAAIAVIGGLASLLFNLLALRGLLWLLTNTTALQGKYGIIGVDSSKVPNILKEEKQTYYGPYADKDLTTKRKPVSIIAGLLFVASVACIVVFGIMNKGNIYVGKTYAKGSNMYFEEVLENVENTNYSEDIIKNYLAEIYTYEDDTAKATNLVSRIDGTPAKWDTPYTSYDSENEETISHYIYFVEFKSYINPESNAFYLENRTETEFTLSNIPAVPAGVDFVQYFDADGNLLKEAPTAASETGTYTLVTGKKGNQDKLSKVIEDSFEVEFTNNSASVLFNTVETYKVGEVNTLKVLLGVGVATLVLGVYFMLRYRLSRGLAMLILGLGSATIATGLFAIIRIGVDAYVVAAAPVVLAFTLILLVILFNREREMVLEDKTRDNGIENRHNIMVKATSSAFPVMATATIISAYLAINFFGFGIDALALAFAGCALLVAASLPLCYKCGGPLAQFFYQLFKRDSSKALERKAKKDKKRKERKKAANKNKGAEPEEAIFIGIND